MNKKITLALLSALALSNASQAQRLLGVATGNYIPTKSIYLNPALMADSRVKWSVDLFSTNLTLDQNYGTLNKGVINDYIKSVFNKNTTTPNFKQSITRGSGDVFSANFPEAEINVLGIYFNIKNKHSFALTSGVRASNQLRDFNSNFLAAISRGKQNITDFGINATNFNQNFNSWAHIGLSYATQVYSKGAHAVSIGATVRYLNGLVYTGLGGKSLIGDYYKSKDSVFVKSLDLTASTSVNTNALNNLNSNNYQEMLKNLFGGKSMGFGGDIGIVYEYRPNASKYVYEMDGDAKRRDPEKDIYKLRFSAALTDIGSINYKNSRQFTAKGSGAINASIADSMENYNQIRDYLRNRGFAIDTAVVNTKVNMPMALVLGLDYNFGKNIFVNATFINGFKPAYDNYSSYTPTQLSITPRYDSRFVGVGIPVTYNFASQSTKVGLGLRITGLYIGSDDLLALLGSSTAKGANFYFGAQIPFNKRRLKDRDGDKVSNKMDKCPNEFGEWAYLGCKPTDRDKDGIIDSLDACPDIPGVASAKGCPDADGDGIADGQDLCPNEPGPIATNGCPDRDGDGIADKDDKCPDVPGLAQFQGCNDTDGDGLGDWEDKCPEKAGPVANQGCPDTDNDGVVDYLDKCPTVPGPASNHGCPVITEQVKKRLAFAATAIQFETGKAIIKKTSYKLLDEIVAILVEYKDYNMKIDGHTDDVGKDDFNLELSKQRAASVKAYFVDKGIENGRLETNGYGKTQPKASNKTAKGRAQNRRVEMDLYLVQ